MTSAQPPIGQQVCDIAHGAPDGKQPHLPPMHTVPPVQAALQPPQLLRSTEVLRHFSPQHVPWQFSGWFGQMSPPPFMSNQPNYNTLLATASKLAVRRADLPSLAAIGALDVGATMLFAAATTKGLLSVVGVLGSFYPLVTVVLAAVVLQERLGGRQRFGALGALAGVALIAAG